jgi:hypothetical protein
VPIDRITAADTDAEAAVESPATERPPPPDRPGQVDVPSRADSRAGAAAANSDVREQANDGPGEVKPETAPSVKDSPGERSSGSVEDTSPVSATTGEYRDQDAETPDADSTADEMIGQAEEVAPLPEEEDVAGGEDVIADDVAIARKDLVPAKDAPEIAEAAKEAKDLPRTAEADRTSAVDKEMPSRRLEPLTDHEYAEHTARVESKVSDSLGHGESTDVQHTLNPERTIWHPDRAEIHQQIVDDLYSAATEVPNDGQAIVAGGLGGAGKSTTLDDHAGIDRSSYLTINPDDIKGSLAKRGLVPPVEGLAPMERSALVHEESSEIARSLAGRAYADRKNVIWDITMSSKLSAAKRVQQLREAGYRNVEGIFVHIPVATSVERAQARHQRGLEDYRNGEGLGGRYVPPDVIRANADAAWGSVNRGVFEELKPQFDKWKLYENSVDGRGPMLLESSDGPERNNDE